MTLGVGESRASAITVPDKSESQVALDVFGVVYDSTGVPDREAFAVVFALPSQERLQDVPSGQQVPLAHVGTFRADAMGRFKLAASAALLEEGGRQGYINLEAIVISKKRQMVHDFSLIPEAESSQAKQGRSWRVAGSDDSDKMLLSHYDFKTATVGRSVPGDTGTREKLSRESIGVSDASSRFADAGVDLVPAVVGPCYLVAGAITTNVKERFVNAYTYGGSIPVTVTVGATAVHTMGVAVSTNGTNWSASGTSSITRSSSASASKTYTSSTSVFNRVNYRDYANSCTGVRQKRPYSFYSILTADGASIPIVWQYYCSHHGAGVIWSTGTATSATISGGVALSVINLSAQSGFSSSLDLTYTFNIDGEVCGNSSLGPLSSSIVQADPF